MIFVFLGVYFLGTRATIKTDYLAAIAEEQKTA